MHPLINGLFVRNSNLEVNGVVSTKVSGCNFVLNALTVYPHCELIIAKNVSVFFINSSRFKFEIELEKVVLTFVFIICFATALLFS